MTTFSPAVAPVLHRLVDCGITLRELEVIDAIADGLTRTQAAQRIRMEPHTVHTHLTRIGDKVGIGTRSGIVGYTYRKGLLLPVPEGPVSMTPEYRSIVRLVAEGLENDEIGAKLEMNADGVRNRLRICMRLLGAVNRVHLVRRGVNTGVLPLTPKGGVS